MVNIHCSNCTLIQSRFDHNIEYCSLSIYELAMSIKESFLFSTIYPRILHYNEEFQKLHNMWLLPTCDKCLSRNKRNLYLVHQPYHSLRNNLVVYFVKFVSSLHLPVHKHLTLSWQMLHHTLSLIKLETVKKWIIHIHEQDSML